MLYEVGYGLLLVLFEKYMLHNQINGDNNSNQK